MEEENKNKEQTTEEILCSVKEEIEKAIKSIIENGLQKDNVDILGQIIDIHKDIANEEYWKEKEEYYMRYRDSYNDSYGRRGVTGTGRGRYRDGSYGDENYGGGRSRDSRGRYVSRTNSGRYRGEDMIEGMHEDYQNYSEGKDMMNRGNYGAKEDTMKSLDYMLESVTEFFGMLQDEASTQEETELIRKYAKKISEM